MLLRWYSAISFVLVATYLAVPSDWRILPFSAVTVAAIPAVLIGARRSPLNARLPWWLMLASLVVFNVGNWVWMYYAYATSRGTGDGTPADVLIGTASLLSLAGSLVVVVRRGRRDIGGVLDSVVTALAVGGLIWSAVLLPHMTATHTPISRQVPLFIDVLAITGTLGGMLRVALVASRPIPATWLLVSGSATTLLGHLAVSLYTDPTTHYRPDWTNMLFLAAYAALGCAALHPSAAVITQPDRAPDDDLTPGRLTFLGFMIASIPLIGGGRALFHLPVDGLLVALGSAMVIPLVMIRIARLAGQRRRAERALRKLAVFDALTGLPNRASCLDRITADLTKAGPAGVAVLFGDLDGFKPVNDRLGHAAGDRLLIEIAQRLRGCVRAPDLVSRFGGDEFVIVCRDDDASDAVGAVCERIRDMVRRPILIDDEVVHIGMSLGVAFADAGDTTDDLLRRADLAMYAAKRDKAIGALSMVTA